MDLKFKKDNLKILYEMCLRELDITRTNIDLYSRKVKDAYIDVLSALENSYGTEDCLVGYDNTLTDLSQFSDALRKFNLKFELTPLFKNITTYDDDSCDSKEAIFEPAEESIRSIQYKVETYTYPQPFYNIYTPGSKFDVIITYIKDANELLFYINNSGNPTYRDFVKQLQNYFNESPEPLNRVPEEGEIVGLHLEGYMFRIVREDGCIPGDNFKAYLLDIGEVCTVTKEMCKKLYVLSPIQQKYCAQAVLCKLKAVNSSTSINLKTYLEKHLYVRHKLIVKKRTDRMLYVNLLNKEKKNPIGHTNSSDSDSTQNHETLSKPITNPFRQFFCVASEYGNDKQRSTITNQFIVKERHEIFNGAVHEETYRINSGSMIPNRTYNNNKSHMTNPQDKFDSLTDYLECSSISDDDLSSIGSSRSFRCSGKKRETITEEQRRVLYEEPLNTTNAMKAVMGYEPKDDKVICPYARPGKESCFKGSRCKFEHDQKLKDGWTRDKVETLIDIPNKIVYPCIGQTITLSVMHIINVELFFAHIISMENRYKETLNELIAKMNASENTPTYKKLKTLPARFQLILAQYRDFMWYRAKVLNYIDNETLKVFYVDYGNADILSLDRIRQWEPKFEYLPFQAILCRLAGVKEIRHTAVEASEFLRSKLMAEKSTIKALVINNIDQLLVRLLIGSNGKDVSEELIKMGYARSFSYDQADRGQLLPA